MELPVWVVVEKQALWIFLKSPSSLLEHFIYSVYDYFFILLIWILWCYQLTHKIVLPQITDNVFFWYILYPCSFPSEWLLGFMCMFFKGFCSYVNFQRHEPKLSLYLHYRIFLQTKTQSKNTCACTLRHLEKLYIHTHLMWRLEFHQYTEWNHKTSRLLNTAISNCKWRPTRCNYIVLFIYS